MSGGKAPWGLGGAGSPPKFNVKWFAKGAILTEPTLFGGGERGAEGIVPLDPLWSKLDKIAEAPKGGDITINVYGAGSDPKSVAEEVKRVLIRETNQRRLAWA